MNVVINVDKPEGLTSHTVCQRVKTELGVKKAGHTGTLDPAATGVLLVCCNKATRIVDYLVGLDKEYIVRMRLGVETDTLDNEGVEIRQMPVPPLTASLVEDALRKYKGDISQVPPMYSALKVQGVPLYKMARNGVEIERKPRAVNIQDIELMELTSPYIKLRVSCSKGTYIRTLCADIARDIGTCCYVDSLIRTRVGPFVVGHSAQVGSLKDTQGAFYSMDDVLSFMQEVGLTSDEVRKITNGQVLPINGPASDNRYVRLKDPLGRLVAVGSVTDKGTKMATLLVEGSNT
ncbi:MAG: tRNA pseudouridine(55) synthase TruB [Nitrospirae bacterium]|nr:tRNA pseudouridine(55) synthase TruB [Nitrospirota bacterium]